MYRINVFVYKGDPRLDSHPQRC